MLSAAFRCAARSAYQASFLIYKGFLSAAGTALSAGFGAVWKIFLQGAFHTHFPSVDRLAVKFQCVDQFKHLVYRHAVSQHSGY